MSSLGKLNGIAVETTGNNSADISKGLVYVYNYDMNDFDSFKASLMEYHGLVYVEPFWIKPQ